MVRLSGMARSGNSIATAGYTAASQLSTLQYGTNAVPFYKSRSYNNLMQLTNLTVSGTGAVNMQYNYTAGQNNGRVSFTTNGVLGETVNYTYDMWNRLTNAAATNGSWGEAYAFDGFGNLTGKTPTAGSAPGLNAPADLTTNRQSGTSYDENRLVTTQPAVNQPTNYTYDPRGRRMWKEVPGGVDSNGNPLPTPCEIYFYGATGQKLETYSCLTNSSGFYLTLEGINIYFGGKLLQAKGVWVATDRLGNVRANSNGETFSYFPYGEERTSTADGREKFGTYTRDGFGQDYAQQRYYNANMGAFWSPDPGGMKNANPLNPSTWNRYSYVMGDPVSRTDIHGLCSDQDKPPCFSTTLTGELPSDPGGGGGGSGTQAPEQGPGGDGGSDGGGGGQQNQALLNSIQSTLDAALSDPACASIFGTPGFLGGNATAKQVLNSLIQGNGPYGSIQFIDPDTATPGQMFLLGSNPAVTVSNHPFWSSLGGRSSSTIYINTLDVGNGFNTSTLNAEELVLHKLGHLLYNLGWSSKILPDPNAAASAANDQKLQNACGKYLK